MAKHRLTSRSPQDIPTTTTGIEAPLALCAAADNQDQPLFAIDTLRLIPNPPRPGDNMTVYAAGLLAEPIVQGSTLQVDVKFGAIQLTSLSLDLCNMTQTTAGLSCPIEAGQQALNFTMPLPENLPRLTYNFQFLGRNADNKTITCVEGAITIPVV
ncbi:Phosphatidylglycerol/phosphatidylinositol transfer protein [Quaeritorhiza haematococci]|nr:Phosphatidylglycerol/phosphatidylinositol transfer protein [Quaeritorhiza haematococci]